MSLEICQPPLRVPPKHLLKALFNIRIEKDTIYFNQVGTLKKRLRTPDLARERDEETCLLNASKYSFAAPTTST